MVRILDVDEQAARGVAQEIVDSGGDTKAYFCDVSSQDSVKAAFEKVFAEGRVSILVNNAGISHVGSLEKTNEHDFDKIFCVNVKGIYNCLYAVIGHMKAHNGGGIFNKASICATPRPSVPLSSFLSKKALVGMTFSFVQEYLGFKNPGKF